MTIAATRKYKKGGMLYDMKRDPRQHTNLVTNPNYGSIEQQLYQRLMKRIEVDRE